MEQTANLELPYIMPSQAQKHVTHNEAIRRLDALVQLTVLDRDLSDPPVSPNDGERYLVAAGGTGAWADRDSQIAAWQDGGWAFFPPKPGWLAWVADEERLVGFDGADWTDAAVHSVNPAPLVGVNTTADAINRLAVRSPAALFDQEAGDHRLKINKAVPGNTASLVFQSGYSGRAEFGLAGDDDWHVKVSADGAAWTEALQVDRSTGRVRLPAALQLGDDDQVVARRHIREKLTANRTYYVRTDGNDGNNGLANTSGGAFSTIQKAVTVAQTLDLNGFNVTIQIADGAYSESVTVAGKLVGQTGRNGLRFTGNLTTPANVIWQVTTTGNVLNVSDGAAASLGGFKMQASGGVGQYCINAERGASILVDGPMEYGASTFAHIQINNFSNLNITAAYTISGDATYHMLISNGSALTFVNIAVTISGSRTFTTFIWCIALANVGTVGNTYMGGSVTGKRYDVALNAAINTNGGGASYFPGNSAGTAATGGQYA